MCPGTVFTSKIGLFQTGFSYCQKHLLDISNRFLGSWMLHLEYYRRRINSFQVVTTQAPSNMAGVTDTHRWFYVENLTFSNRFYILSIIFFRYFKWLTGIVLLRLYMENRFFIKGNQLDPLKHGRDCHCWFYKENRTFSNRFLIV